MFTVLKAASQDWQTGYDRDRWLSFEGWGLEALGWCFNCSRSAI
jgi:hypothetical protein